MKARSQRGAALLIVLLLVATLSFVVMAIGERMMLASHRSANTRVRAELLWRAVGAEALARAGIETAVKTDGFKFVAENPIFDKQRDIPMENGGAVVAFRDATRCFNVNAFAAANRDETETEASAPLAELQRIIEAANIVDADAAPIAASIADWIDKDSFETPQGGEDGRYTALPAPYRAGNGAIADVTELRAAGLSAEAFLGLRPFLCALPATDAAPLNINMLTASDAALVVGLAGDGVTLAAATGAIENRPAGGYASADQFWADPAFAGKEIPERVKARVSLKSRYVEAEAAIRFADQSVVATMLFSLEENGDAKLVSRALRPVWR